MMEYTIEERANRIIEHALKLDSSDPIVIFNILAKEEFVRIHGPEHHVLDGVALLVAYYNAGGDINLKEAINILLGRALKMPGAMCGHWGVCGAVSSMGAALSVIDNTGPLSNDGNWGKHMLFTSRALESLAKINGPRCCKRDAYLSFIEAIKYINANYDVKIPLSNIKCEFYPNNSECLGNRCPFRKQKIKVAFVCVHNSCRSQIAEALAKHLASDVFESYSFGSEVKTNINQDAVRIMKAIYGIDMELSQYPKLINDIPEVDIMISMGCNVKCPNVDKTFDDDWALDDPSGKDDASYKAVIKEIEQKILELKDYISRH